ncbi:hypothetical protein [Corynebacterium aquatimens]|uniref:Uncharacterized protein n=1 Tax=Corynebacterium aquatimens TaxID=1190508 RepID=A0A931DXA3_9CORY|nr:hypothetical protein [Corynebacterium aquatimens]MBG6121805.1 hypothetical protein [Corynebacterium aquatimens]WJY65656.1 hypothetical protein CAQUA_04715 [Corynebacterium aquatimens]
MGNSNHDATPADIEKEAAKTIDLGKTRQALLLVAIGVYLTSIAMPWVGDAKGWQVLFFTEAPEIRTAITERIFAILSFLCLPVFSGLLVATKRSIFSLLAWAVGSVTLVSALLGLWLRQTGEAAQQGITTNYGFYLAIATVIIAVPVLMSAWITRSPEQLRAEQLRRENSDFNPVAEVQTNAAHQAIRRTDGSTGIVDDRRARAAQRHKRTQ